ncbi:MAG: sigma-70 family RNA polymerase sigma factor [Pseudomonadota bacterium]
MPAIDALETEQIYGKHRDDLVRLATTIVGCPALAEDVVHEAFLQYARKSKDGDIESAFAYLFGMVRHLSIDLVRREVRERRTFTPYHHYEMLDTIQDSRPSPEHIAVQRDEQRAFNEAIEELPHLMRRAVRAHLIEGMKIRQIAERLGISVGQAHGLVRDGVQLCERRLRNMNAGPS